MKRTYIAATILALMVYAADVHANGLPQPATSTNSVTSDGSPIVGNNEITWPQLYAATAAASQYKLPAWAKRHRRVLKRISKILAKGNQKKAIGLYRLFLRAAYRKRDPRVRAKLRRAVDVERWIVREAYLRHHPRLGTLVDKMRYHHIAEQRLNGCLSKLMALRKTVGHKRVSACRIVLRRRFRPGANPVWKHRQPRLNAERLGDAIKEIEIMVNRVRNEQQVVSSQFEGASAANKQILHMLSTVLRALSVARNVGVGHIRQPRAPRRPYRTTGGDGCTP